MHGKTFPYASPMSPSPVKFTIKTAIKEDCKTQINKTDKYGICISNLHVCFKQLGFGSPKYCLWAFVCHCLPNRRPPSAPGQLLSAQRDPLLWCERKEPCCRCLLMLFLAASPFQRRLNSSETAGGPHACLAVCLMPPCPERWVFLIHPPPPRLTDPLTQLALSWQEVME